MHLITDENGNPIPHGHEACPHQEGCEEHTHCHEGEQHEHCHHHEHHEHAHPAADVSKPDQMSALLEYMLTHNQHHAKELDDLAKKLTEAGKGAVAEQIKKAVDEFEKGNLYLSLAVSTLKDS